MGGGVTVEHRFLCPSPDPLCMFDGGARFSWLITVRNRCFVCHVRRHVIRSRWSYSKCRSIDSRAIENAALLCHESFPMYCEREIGI